MAIPCSREKPLITDRQGFVILPTLLLLLFSPFTSGQELQNAEATFSPNPDNAQRCVPAEITYTHVGAVDDHTLILANANNDVIVASLKSACPRVLDEDKVMLLMQKGEGLSNLEQRMCADDVFIMVRATTVSVNNADLLRHCQFRAFHLVPAADVLGIVKNNGIMFRPFGTF